MKKFLKLSAIICLFVAISCVFAGCSSVDLQKIKDNLSEKEPDFVITVLQDANNSSSLSLNMSSILSSQVPDYQTKGVSSLMVGHDKYNLSRFAIVVVFEDKEVAKQAKENIETNYNGESIVKLSGSTLYIASTENLMKIIK